MRGLSPDLDPQKGAALAEGLDRKLFESSPTFEAYANTDTLDYRLKALATGICLQLKHKRQASAISRCFVEERKKLLLKRVGSSLYDEIFHLVDEIEKIRRTDNDWTASWTKRKESEDAQLAAETVPPVIRAVYFGNNGIVNAVRHLTASSKESLDAKMIEEVDWEALVEEARDILFRFYDAEREAKATGKAMLGCNNGTCCFK